MNTPDILKKILNRKAVEIRERQAAVPMEDLRQQAAVAPACRGFYRSLRARLDLGQPAVIAEMKKASPSRGVLREDFDPAAIARSYEKAGAACLSVLTDVDFFQGCDEDLRRVRDACSLPVLRKDFIIDPYQIHEARAFGADCILLIAAALTDEQMLELANLARAYDMDVLVEVHNREELERGMMLRTPMIGINNRNLHTFETRIETTIDLLVDVYEDRTIITESGIHSRDDVLMLRKEGVHAFLVGEAFMAVDDPGEKLRELFY